VVGVLLILTLLITPGATAERLTAAPGRATAYSIAIALFSVLGGILLSLLTNLPVSFFVTALSFACYLLGRFLVGPMLVRRKRSRGGTRRGVAATAD
jgi:zinc/manganese transport system permease protein